MNNPESATPPNTTPISKVEIGNVVNISAKDIMNEMALVYSTFKSKGLKTPEECDAYLKTVQEKHRNLFSSYPTVIRHMIQDNMYSQKIFDRYIMLLNKNPWKNDSERFDSYTSYFMMLYRDKHPHFNVREARSVKQEYRGKLEAEHKKFREYLEKFTREVDEEQKTIENARRKSAVEALKKLAQAHNLKQAFVTGITDALYEGRLNAEDLEKICLELSTMSPEELATAPKTEPQTPEGEIIVSAVSPSKPTVINVDSTGVIIPQDEHQNAGSAPGSRGGTPCVSPQLRRNVIPDDLKKHLDEANAHAETLAQRIAVLNEQLANANANTDSHVNTVNENVEQNNNMNNMDVTFSDNVANIVVEDL